MSIDQSIKLKFKELKERKEIALVVYITAGFPSFAESINNIRLIAKNGADMIEIGVPFSDPVADGPTIQYSSGVALSRGVNLGRIIRAVKSLKLNTPLILMSYLNPLLAYGKERLLNDIKEAGFRGIIIPDLPVEEADDLLMLTQRHNVDFIFLVAPTSSRDRIKIISERSRGFIYCVSSTGTTGMKDKLPTALFDLIVNVRELTDKPIAVGFGISNPEQIRALSTKVDGVIVGSRIIEAIKNGQDLPVIIRGLKDACVVSNSSLRQRLRRVN